MLFDRLLRPRADSRTASLENPSVSIQDADAWSEAFGWGGTTDAGEAVSPQTAISLSAFWAAVKMISGDVSRLPLQTYRRTADAKPTPDDSHYLTTRIGPDGVANEEMSAIKLWRRAMVQALIYENAYVWLDWDGARVRGLYLLLSDRTAVVRHRGRKYVVTEIGSAGEIAARPYDEVLHIEGLCLDNTAGSEAVRQAREDIGTALASRKFKAKFFGQGMHAGGVLQVPPGANPIAQQKIEHAIENQHTSTNKAFRVLVLRDGFKWHSTQVHPEQAQLTEIDEAGVRDIARRFLVSPSRLGVKDSFSYNSLAMDRRDYYDTTLAYWLSIIESELNTKALTEQERTRWRIAYAANLALLFADASTLATIGFNGINARDGEGRSVFLRNEVRSWFGLRPLADDEGIAESKAPPAEPDTDSGDEQDDDSTDGDDETREASRSAHRELLAAELGRLVRRLNVHTERAITRNSFGMWFESFDLEHRDVAHESLEPVVRACQAAGVLCAESGSSPLAADIADRLFVAYRGAIATVGPAEDRHAAWKELVPSIAVHESLAAALIS